MADKKKYIITSVTLGAIAAVSAGLIGLTNLLTRDQIAANATKKINSGISEIFGKNASISQELAYKDSGLTGDYKYIEYVYSVSDDTNQDLGYAFKTTGSNMYGKISLIIGFGGNDHSFLGLSIVVNEQTYASTLVDKYINPLNDGTRELDDVTCGATYGAKLVKEMVDISKSAAEELWKD